MRPIHYIILGATRSRASRSLILGILHRHCEEPLRRSNPSRGVLAVDCFAHRTAPCAEPVARNDGFKNPYFIGGIFGSLAG
jgi:hypothetical protein